MNRLNFNQSVGFPLETNILDEMQTSWGIFNALGALAGNFTIISGCETIGTTVRDGVVFINGEVLEFKGGLAQDNVIIVETKQALEFEDGNTHDVVFTRYATFGVATTQWPWSDFKRGIETKELASMFSGINNLLSIINIKLATIETGAQKQINSDWNATTGVSKILNKPNITDPFLLKGTYPLGDLIGSEDSKTVTFSDVGTTNYMVIGCLVSKGTMAYDDDITFVIRDKTAISFKIVTNDSGSPTQVQNLDFDYVLVKL